MTSLDVFLIVVAVVFGLVVGSFLNVVIYRVPAGIPLTRASRCPSCEAEITPLQNVPVISWMFLRARCANCAAPISVRYPLVEAGTGLVFGGVTAYFLAAIEHATAIDSWYVGIVLAAYLYFASVSIALALIDLDVHRLPNAIVLPSYLVASALFVAAAAVGGGWLALLRAAIGMAVLYAFYFVVRLIRPDAMGGGDVKLAGLVGIYLGWIGWGALAVGAFAAFFFGGIVGIGLILARRAGRKTAIPFGPFILIGAWTGVLAGEAIGSGYLDLYSGT